MTIVYRYLAALFVVHITGCASAPMHSAPGLQPVERRILRNFSIWLTEPGPYAATPYHYSGEALRGEPGALHRFFRQSVTGKLDGERAETYTHDTYLLLFQLGDAAFARALANETITVRQQMHKRLTCMFAYWHLIYPQTQAVLEGHPLAQ